jgi:large subunit ribosomal protein L13
MKKTRLPTSTLLTKEEAIAERKWLLLDAKGKTLGRFASEVAKILRGKHKPNFTPHVDCGDGVIVINANQIKVTGAKEAQKIYYHHTGKSNGLRETPFRVMLDRHPDRIIWEAVKGMMPLSRLGRQQMKKLRIYANDVHDLEAQQPISLTV